MARYPEAIFAVAACLLSLAVFCLSGISPAEKNIVDSGGHDHEQEIDDQDDSAVP